MAGYLGLQLLAAPCHTILLHFARSAAQRFFQPTEHEFRAQMPQPVKSIVVKEVQHDGTVITERPKFRSDQSFNSYLQRACVRVRLVCQVSQAGTTIYLLVCTSQRYQSNCICSPRPPPWTLSAVPP